jgi:hypothetical protein
VEAWSLGGVESGRRGVAEPHFETSWSHILSKSKKSKEFDDKTACFLPRQTMFVSNKVFSLFLLAAPCAAAAGKIAP